MAWVISVLLRQIHSKFMEILGKVAMNHIKGTLNGEEKMNAKWDPVKEGLVQEIAAKHVKDVSGYGDFGAFLLLFFLCFVIANTIALPQYVVEIAAKWRCLCSQLHICPNTLFTSKWCNDLLVFFLYFVITNAKK
eukprot:53341_1